MKCGLVSGRWLLTGLLLSAGLVRAASTADSPEQRLQLAREEIAGLERKYADRHPRLIEARARGAAWQRQIAAGHREPFLLAQARVEEEVMRLRYLDRHPALLSLQARIAAMEKQWRAAPDSPEVLLEAVGDLAADSIRWGEANPRYQDQLRLVAALRLHLQEPAGDPAELRLARAMRDYYAGRYDVNHPRMQEIVAQLAELEKR
jgi:hypothetical protein